MPKRPSKAHDERYPTPTVLIAIMNNRRDFDIAKTQGWYRIPVKSADRFIKNLSQMQHLAFYQTKVFDEEAHAVNYIAEIQLMTTVPRSALLPNERRNANTLYHKIEISLPVCKLPRPIRDPNPKERFMKFITTTPEKFSNATEIDDLYHTSPLEDRMWEALKASNIQAVRQHEIREEKANYNLDFAIACKDGEKINIECNGDTYHATKTARDKDRQRNTYLTTKGWHVQRFGTDQILHDIDGCISYIRELMNRHGGPKERNLDYDLYQSEENPQLKLFDS